MNTPEAQVRSTVLVVEAAEAQRVPVVRLLAEAGHAVVAAETGAEALQELNGGRVDLVVIGEQLPDYGPLATCSRIQADSHTRDVPVLHVSASCADPEHRARAMEAGADACLVFPLHAREFLATIHALLRVHRQDAYSEATKLHDTLESISDAFLALDADWRITYFNKRAEEVLGKKRDVMLGRVLWDEYPEAVDSVFFKTYDRVRRSRKSDVIEAFYPPLNAWFQSHAYPAPNGGVGVYFQDVTERHRHQAALRESEQWLRLATERIGIGLWRREVASETTVFTEISRRIHGLATDVEVTQENLLGALHPEDRSRLVSKLNAVESGETRDYANEYRVKWPDGSEHWVHSRAVPLNDESGQLVRLLGVAEDISERKTLELELAQATQLAEASLRQLETIIENMAEAICVLDADGVVLLTNRGFRDILGDQNTPHVPRHFEKFQEVVNFYDPETGDAVPFGNWPVAHVLRGATIRNHLLRAVRTDIGKDLVLSTSGAPVRDSSGKVKMAVMTVQDITALAEAQRDLRASQQHLELAQRAAQLGSFDWDIRGQRPIYWTRELERIYGLAPGGWSGDYKQWRALVFPEDLAATEQAVQTSVMDGTEFQTEFRIRRADTGEIRWVAARGQPYYDAEGNPTRMVGVNIDVTDRRQAEEALRSSEKLAAAGRMAGTLAHEINNPMAAITNLVYLLGQNAGLDATARSYVHIAEQELVRVQHIIKNTLGFYRESVVPVQVLVSEVLDSVLDLYNRKITDKAISVDKQYAYLGTIYGYPGELRQVFSNLVVNAIEALPEHGRLTLKTRPWRQPNGGAEGVRITIADDGPGIPTDLRQKIFEPFFTTKGEKGTGLGLWVTKGIIAKHSGWLRVRSSSDGPYRGTSFIVFLPTAVEAIDARRQIPAIQTFS